MKKIIICNIVALAILISAAACSDTHIVAPPGENRIYTMDEILDIASKFDPDCRKFAQAADNITPSG
jgi:hypothetical protein